MKATFRFYPKGDPGMQYSEDVEISVLPAVGHSICFYGGKEEGSAYFTVMSVTHYFIRRDERLAEKPTADESEVYINCEFVEGPSSSDSHKRVISLYKERLEMYGDLTKNGES